MLADDQCTSQGECTWPTEPPPPPPPTTASYEWGTGIGRSGSEGSVEYTHLRSWSNSKAGVQTASLESRYYWGESCSPTSWNYYTTDAKTITANGYAVDLVFSRYFSHTATRQVTYRVDATHTFVPLPGVSGGGTYKSWTRYCWPNSPRSGVGPYSGG